MSQEQSKVFIKITSAAFGRASYGIVKVFLPEEGVHSPTLFSEIEWPELVANGEVTEIEWVNPNNEDETKTIWKTGDGEVPFLLGISDIGH